GPAAVLAGLLVHRFDGAGVLAELLATGVAHATTPWAKSLVDESAPGFAGTWASSSPHRRLDHPVGGIQPQQPLRTLERCRHRRPSRSTSWVSAPQPQ